MVLCFPHHNVVVLFFVFVIENFPTLVDSGAGASFMDRSLIEEFKIPLNDVEGQIALANGTRVKRDGRTDPITLTAIFHLKEFDDHTFTHKFDALDLSKSIHKFIIGSDLIRTIFPSPCPLDYFSDPPKEVIPLHAIELLDPPLVHPYSDNDDVLCGNVNVNVNTVNTASTGYCSLYW